MKVELNKIFVVEKGKRKTKWKVIEHPYFPCLTLVHEYSRMTNEVKQEDFEHMGGSVTLENAYERAYMYT